MKKSIPYKEESEVIQLVRAFEQKSCPLEKWTHEAHLTTAMFYQYYHSFEESVSLMRCGIICYNDAVGPGNTPDSGYHETITLFWMWLIKNYRKSNTGIFMDLLHRFLCSKYAGKDVPLVFYSKDLLTSKKARAIWIDPDKSKLDFHII